MTILQKSQESCSVQNIVSTIAVGVSTAGLIYFIFKYYNYQYSKPEKPKTWKKYLKDNIENAQSFVSGIKEDVTNIYDETVHSIQTGVEEKLEDFLDELKNKLLSEETNETLDTIALLCNYVNKFDMNGKPYNGHFLILLAIVKKVQSLTEFTAWEKSLPSQSQISPVQCFRAKRFGQFALGIYRASRETTTENVAEKMGLKPEEILYMGFKTDHEGLCPKFIVVVDHENRYFIYTSILIDLMNSNQINLFYPLIHIQISLVRNLLT